MTRVAAPIPAESKANDFPVDLAAALAPYDAAMFIWLPPGVAASRPVASLAGRVYYATDWATAHPTSPLQLDTGSAWIDFTTRQQMHLPFFVSGAFTAGLRPACWLAPAPCILNYGYATVDSGNPVGSATLKWQLAVNGTPVASTLSPTLVLGASVQKNQFSSALVIGEGDRVQLNINTTANTVADLSVTIGGAWTGGNHP
jgi:hypothetical protein